MKKLYVLLVFLLMSSMIFADNIVKNTLTRVEVTSLPFNCTKFTRFSYPIQGFPYDIDLGLPLETYLDLGLIQKNTAPSEVAVFRKFKDRTGRFDLVVLDIEVSEWKKRLLVTYNDGNLVDFIECQVCWFPAESLFVKQWRIDKDCNIVVTWLKIDNPTPINAHSDFTSVNAQRIDTYYTVDTNGKFHQLKQVKFQPKNYTRAYLNDRTKDIWNGGEVPLAE